MLCWMTVTADSFEWKMYKLSKVTKEDQESSTGCKVEKKAHNSIIHFCEGRRMRQENDHIAWTSASTITGNGKGSEKQDNNSKIHNKSTALGLCEPECM